MERDEAIRKIEELRQRAGLKKPDLVINSVPEKELSWFLAWSDAEFGGHRGMAFKWLCAGYAPPENSQLKSEIDELRREIANLKEKRETTEKPLTSLNGTIIRGSART